MRHRATQEFFQDESVRNIRIRKDRPCGVCGGTPTKYVRERIPGSKGNMSQSFAGEYRLCEPCLVRAQRCGAISDVRSKGNGMEERITVYAKTFAWLKGMKSK